MDQQRVTDTKDPNWGMVVTDTKDPNWGMPVTATTTTPAANPASGQSHGAAIDYIYNVLARAGSNVKSGLEQGANVVSDTASQFLSHPGLSVASPGSALAVGLAKNVVAPVVKASGDEFTQAKNAASDGNYGQMAAHAAAIAPVIGPAVDNWQRMIRNGESDKVIGDILTMVGPSLVAMALPKTVSVGIAQGTTPEASAVRFGMQNGVTPDLGTAIGGKTGAVVRALDQSAQKMTLAGAKVGGDLEASRATGMASLGEQLAAKANSGGPAVGLAEAGERLNTSASAVVKTKGAAASNQYQLLQAMEKSDPVKFAVDVSSAQDALRPIYDTMVRRAKDMNLQYQGPERRMFEALDDLMRAPNTAPLSSADKALSVLKDMQRSNPDKFGDAGNVINQAVGALDNQVVQTAKDAGPVAFDALQKGRKLTQQKYDALSVVDKMKTEPLSTLNALNKANDGGIAFLRDANRIVPEEMPNVGRAILGDLMKKADPATAARDTSAATWESLGTETKKIVFADQLAKNPTYLSDLDKFFRLNKMLKANPNPSGSAYVGGLSMHAGSMLGGVDGFLSGLGLEVAAALGTALSSPRVVRALNRGMTVPVGNVAAAQAASAEILTALKSAGMPVPVTAQDNTGAIR